MDWLNSSHAVIFNLPSLQTFKIPSSPTISIPLKHRNDPVGNLFHPLEASPAIFYSSINPQFVFTFVAAYVTSVLLWNQINAGRNFKAWALSRTSIFRKTVTLHNFVLALFSAWSLCGIIYSIRTHWLFVKSNIGVISPVHLVEFSCQMDQREYRVLPPHMYGTKDAVIYVHWVFYLSKFYEVVDTLIILLRGKTSSTLQTFHHAGVILIGWVGLRYESPMAPAGAALNALVHTLMYSYFTLQTLGISIPKNFKRALTSIQIAQFIVGLGFAFFYLFISYKAPNGVAGKSIHTEVAALPPSLRTHENDPIDHDGLTTIRCLGDGKGFPLIVASSYLLPLIYLFVRFYMKTYTASAAKSK